MPCKFGHVTLEISSQRNPRTPPCGYGQAATVNNACWPGAMWVLTERPVVFEAWIQGGVQRDLSAPPPHSPSLVQTSVPAPPTHSPSLYASTPTLPLAHADCRSLTLIDSYGEVSRGERMLYSGTDPESYITEYTLVYEDIMK